MTITLKQLRDITPFPTCERLYEWEASARDNYNNILLAMDPNFSSFHTLNVYEKRQPGDRSIRAKRPFEKGDTVAHFDGERITINEALRRAQAYGKHSAWDAKMIQLSDDKYVIDATTQHHYWGSSIGHSFEPNCKLVDIRIGRFWTDYPQCSKLGHLHVAFIIADRNIARGEQLTVNYATGLKCSGLQDECKCTGNLCLNNRTLSPFMPDKCFFLKKKDLPKTAPIIKVVHTL
jgi:hypothetical protein